MPPRDEGVRGAMVMPPRDACKGEGAVVMPPRDEQGRGAMLMVW